MRDSQLFDKAVEAFFEPLARKYGLPLAEVRDGVYDIPSPHFVVRLRLDTGHRRGLNVILRPASFRDFDENDPGIEQIGIGWFIDFYQEKRHETFIDVSTDEDFLEQARLLAMATERFCMPYLLGEGKDWETIKGMVEKKQKISLSEHKY